jgi:hypothetical protein
MKDYNLLEKKIADEYSRLQTLDKANFISNLKNVKTHIVVPKGKYVIDSNIIVDKKGILEIEPGATFLFGTEAGIISHGVLRAIGTETEKIVFTAKSNPLKNLLIMDKWRNITIEGESANDSILAYCDISKGWGRNKSPNLEDSFDYNSFEYKGLTRGGGILIIKSDPTITNTTIKNNFAYMGGGLYLIKSNSKLLNNIIEDNFADSEGGGIFLDQANSTIINNMIRLNFVKGFGGGGLYASLSNPILNKNTIEYNSACFGGGLYLYKSYPDLSGNFIDNNKNLIGENKHEFIDMSNPYH